MHRRGNASIPVQFLERFGVADSHRAFALDRELPIRASVYCGDDEDVLLITAHHLALMHGPPRCSWRICGLWLPRRPQLIREAAGSVPSFSKAPSRGQLLHRGARFLYPEATVIERAFIKAATGRTRACPMSTNRCHAVRPSTGMVPNEVTLNRVLVRNPKALYGFPKRA